MRWAEAEVAWTEVIGKCNGKQFRPCISHSMFSLSRDRSNDTVYIF